MRPTWNEKFVFVFWARRCSDHTCPCGNWAREELFSELVILKPVSSQSSPGVLCAPQLLPKGGQTAAVMHRAVLKAEARLLFSLGVTTQCALPLLQAPAVTFASCLPYVTRHFLSGYFCFFLLNQTIKLCSPKLCWQHCIFPAELKVFLTCRSKPMCLLCVYLRCLAMHALILLCCNLMVCRQPQAAQLPTVLQLCHSAEGDSDSVPDMPSGVWADWGESLLNLPLLSVNTSSTRFTALAVASLLKDSLSFCSLT